MNHPSLNEFAEKSTEKESTADKPLKDGEAMKGITLRLKRSQWQSLVAMTNLDSIKIQPYMLSLIKADFDRRGLDF